MAWIYIIGWLVWFLGGLWLTVRCITAERDFMGWEIWPAAFCCAIAGPVVALAVLPDPSQKPLFKKRR